MPEVPMQSDATTGRGPARSGLGPAALFLVGILVGAASGGAAGAYVVRSLPAVPMEASSAPSTATAAPTIAIPAPAAGASTEQVVSVVNDVLPSVVTVLNKLPNGRTQSSGSGFVIDQARGYIVTNNHVVENVQSQGTGASFDVIFSDNKTATAKLVGRDQQTDIAVLQIAPPSVKAIQLGDSDAAPVGSTVVAIGSALGDFRNSVTVGIVSAKGRRLPSESRPDVFLEDLIQTDAAISPGNSGGPLILAATHQVIGMNTLVIRETGSEGLGFAISSKTIKQISDELIKNGRVQRAFIGVTYQIVTARSAAVLGLPANTTGVLIAGVQAGSPAAQVGLRQNDVITKLNDEQIDDVHPLATVLLKFRAGDRVTLTIIRDGKQQTVAITLANQT